MAKKVARIRSFIAPIAQFGASPTVAPTLHHEAEYDSEGRVIKETKYFEDGTTDVVHEYRYDSQGRIVEEVLYYALSESTECTQTRYDDGRQQMESVVIYDDEEEGERTITRFDSEQQPVEITRYDEDGELEGRETLRYYRPGKVLEHEWYDAQDELVKKEANQYNAKDQLVAQTIWSADPEEINQTVTITHQPGKTIAEARDEDGELLYTRVHEMDEKGRIRRLVHADANGQQQEQRTEYDEADHLVMQEWRNGGGQVMRKQLFSYDDEGQLAEETLFEPNPYEARNSHYVIRYETEWHT